MLKKSAAIVSFESRPFEKSSHGIVVSGIIWDDKNNGVITKFNPLEGRECSTSINANFYTGKAPFPAMYLPLDEAIEFFRKSVALLERLKREDLKRGVE